MRIQVVSDLHVDNWIRSRGPFWFKESFLPSILTDSDVLVVAGDAVSWKATSSHSSLLKLKILASAYPHVVYVLGNHEYWGASIPMARNNARKALRSEPNIHLLESGSPVFIQGQRFLGDTMWFPRPPDTAPSGFADFSYIHDFRQHVYNEHSKFRNFMFKELDKEDVVVTHHSPSSRSIHAMWCNSSVNWFFCASEMERDVILPKQPKIWVHGHMHQPFDYTVGETRVICNPVGYPDEEIARFDPKKIVEV